MSPRLHPVPLAQVTFADAFWAPRLETTRRVTLPTELQHLHDTGHIDAYRLNWQPGDENPPHVFWDSDLAKWLEAAAYSLTTHPDPALEAQVRDLAALIASAQQPDGYLNPHYTVVDPQGRWSNLRDQHELYCAGHLIEAAVAHHQATGDLTLLDALRRYADLIGATFGTAPGQLRGYPGHEEIELALVRLYRHTGEQCYLDLARYFIEERGRQPYYYDQEAEARGDNPSQWYGHDYRCLQAHSPVREQTTAEGHAVRAMYLYSGMVDVGVETGDETLLDAARTLWRNVVDRRMYVTGSVGSAADGERFTWDYHLPSESAYAETCAAIGLAFFAHRLLQAEPKAEYADVLERALYNGALAGISLSGDRFAYVNPLSLDYHAYQKTVDLYGHSSVVPERQPWFGCACCPPNIARLLLSLPAYAYSTAGDAAYVHLYAAGSARLDLDGGQVALEVETRYPWEGRVQLQVRLPEPCEFTLALRLPGWCAAPQLAVNGEGVDLAAVTRDGYAYLQRLWQLGDEVTLDLPMPAQRLCARPEVRDTLGRVVLQRGPIVYCLEEVDNGAGIYQLRLPADAPIISDWRPDLLGGVTVLRAEGRQTVATGAALYSDAPPTEEAVPLIFVPYYAWGNRSPGDMVVWVRE